MGRTRRGDSSTNSSIVVEVVAAAEVCVFVCFMQIDGDWETIREGEMHRTGKKKAGQSL